MLDLIFMAALVAAAARVGSGLEHFKDLEMPDESNYLFLGEHFFSGLRPPADAAPLYSLWYNALSFVRRDPIDLFYLNARLTVALPALMLFLLLRARRVSAEAAALMAFLFLISPANVKIWPRVSHMALALLLGGFAIESRVASPGRKTLVLALAALLAAYCRPEFYLAFAGLCALWPWLVFRNRRSWPARRELASLAVFALAAGALHAYFGMPMFHGEGRSFFAFGQHYALNYVARTKSGLSPWLDWPQIMAREFGAGVHSVGQALAARPDLFRQHLADNLNRFFTDYWECCRKLPVPIWPVGWNPSWEMLLGGATIVAYLFFLRRWTGIGLSAAGAALRGWFSLDELARVLAVIAPGLASCIVIYPRWHYLLPLATAPVIAGAVLGSRLARERGRLKPGIADGSSANTPSTSAGLADEAVRDPRIPLWIKCLISICIALMILPLTPTALDYSHDSMERVSTIRLIRKLNVRGEVNLLEGDGSYAVYLDWHYRAIFYCNKNEPFFSFMKKNKLGMIKTDPQIVWDSRYRDDPQWREFLKDPQAHGFVVLRLYENGKALLARKDLLES